MKFFGMFKSKEEKEQKRKHDKLFNRLFNRIYPNGSDQIAKDVEYIYYLLDEKYPKDLLEKTYMHMNSLYYLSDDKDEQLIIGSEMINSDNKIDKDDLERIIKYIKYNYLNRQREEIEVMVESMLRK